MYSGSIASKDLIVKRVTASVDDELWSRVDQMAREQGRSVSSMVAALLTLAVFPGGRIAPPVVDRRSARGIRKVRGKSTGEVVE